MITVETIARILCKYGQCKQCDADCIDYKAAKNVAAFLRSEGVKVEDD